MLASHSVSAVVTLRGATIDPAALPGRPAEAAR
jgi:hypothetical protein